MSEDRTPYRAGEVAPAPVDDPDMPARLRALIDEVYTFQQGAEADMKRYPHEDQWAAYHRGQENAFGWVVYHLAALLSPAPAPSAPAPSTEEERG